jgi:phosphoadenosine phosphosulfate reductase
MVLLDMGLRVDPGMAVVYVDTDYLFPETHSTLRAVEARYGIKPLAFRSDLTTHQQADMHGSALWERDPDLCCALRKVEPMRRALSGYDAYLTGLRRDQAETRRDTPAVQWDAKFGLFKLNPLVDWDEKQTWSYIIDNGLPYNPLHDQGFPSIGCTNCTRAVKPGEDPRAGRWSGTDKIECGLHVA